MAEDLKVADARMLQVLARRLQEARHLTLAAALAGEDSQVTRHRELLENVEELLRDASHLVASSMIMSWAGDEPTEAGGVE